MATTQPPFPAPNINVVPSGFRWSAEAAQKAAAKAAFLRVGGAQGSRRFLSGAKRSWTSAKPEENRTIFHTGYRITGTPEAITTALTYAGIPQDQIQQVLATAITKDNFNNTMAGEVQKELAAHEAVKLAKPVAEGYEWEQILWFGQNIKNAIIATKTGEQKGAVASPGRSGAGEPIADKIKKLAQGKVLDVSNMDIKTGKGVRTMNAPKTDRSGKFGTGRIPIISNDINKYVRALQLAYGADAEAQYAADIAVVRQALTNVAAPTLVGQGIPRQAEAPRVPSPRLPSPLRGTSPPRGTSPNRVPSPVRVPGQTLAPVPQFKPAQGQATIVPQVASPRGAPVGTIGGTNLPNIPQLNTLLQGNQRQ